MEHMPEYDPTKDVERREVEELRHLEERQGYLRGERSKFEDAMRPLGTSDQDLAKDRQYQNSITHLDEEMARNEQKIHELGRKLSK